MKKLLSPTAYLPGQNLHPLLALLVRAGHQKERALRALQSREGGEGGGGCGDGVRGEECSGGGDGAEDTNSKQWALPMSKFCETETQSCRSITRMGLGSWQGACSSGRRGERGTGGGRRGERGRRGWRRRQGDGSSGASKTHAAFRVVAECLTLQHEPSLLPVLQEEKGNTNTHDEMMSALCRNTAAVRIL